MLGPMVAINGWNVSVEYVTTIMNQDGKFTDLQSTCLLKVIRFPHGYSSPRERCPECYGVEFSTPDDAYIHARGHGHLA